jgi:hypothetical protein
MNYWIAFALLILLALAAFVARGALPWRRGAALLAIAVLAVAAIEVLVRAGVIGADDASRALSAIAVGMVLLATLVARRDRRGDGGPPQ